MYERFSEPIHLNVLSIFIALFGSYRSKVACDLVLRHQHAFGLLSAAGQAKQPGYERISVFEFGVAAGAGLLNLQSISMDVAKNTGIAIDIYGLDRGTGMPRPKSFKDHPELH